MFATRRFRDEVGLIAGNIGSASFSASGAASGTILDTSKFQKYVFILQCSGTQNANKSIAVYSCSTSASSISSASSNWAQVDSASCIVTLASASASASAGTFAAVLELRAEKLFSGIAPIRYIRPVVTCGSGVASNAVDTIQFMTFGLLPSYGTASSQESPAMTLVVETDYL